MLWDASTFYVARFLPLQRVQALVLLHDRAPGFMFMFPYHVVADCTILASTALYALNQHAWGARCGYRVVARDCGADCACPLFTFFGCGVLVGGGGKLGRALFPVEACRTDCLWWFVLVGEVLSVDRKLEVRCSGCLEWGGDLG